MGNEMTRRRLIQLGFAGAGAVALPSALVGCSSSSSTSTAAPSTTANEIDALLTAARTEGKLNLIAVSNGPDSPYRAVIDQFVDATKLKIDFQSPDAGSGMEVDAARDLKGKPNQPDVIDVGLSSILQAKDDGLLDSFTPDNWATIPNSAKDADGYWLSSYYALLGIVSNPTLLGDNEIPTSFDDLLQLKGGVKMGFPGDPRTTKDAGPLASASAFGAVWTAALAQGGSLDDIGPGIDFLAELAHRGTFDPQMVGIVATVGGGAPVPITMLIGSEFLFARSKLKAAKPDQDLQMRIVNADKLYPTLYAQALVNKSPHPYAAKLWLQHLISDEGAKGFLKGGMVPTRFPVLLQQGTVSEKNLAAFEDFGLPAKTLAKSLAAVQIPSVDQVSAAQDAVNTRWGPDVRGD